MFCELTGKASLWYVVLHLSNDGLVFLEKFISTLPVFLVVLKLLLEITHLHLSLEFHLFPVDTGWEDRLLGWVTGHHLLSLIDDLVLVELFHLSPDIKLEHGLVVLIPTVFDAGNIETRQSQDTWNACAAGNEDSELPGFLLGVQTIVVLYSDIEIWSYDTEDCDQEEEHWNGSASNSCITNSWKNSNGWLTPSCRQEILDEQPSHAYPEVVVAKIDHQTARYWYQCGANTNVSLCHVVDVVVIIRDNSSSQGANEAASQSTNSWPEGELLLVASIHHEVLPVEQTHSNTLLCPKASCKKDPESAVINKNLPYCFEVIEEPVRAIVLVFSLNVKPSSCHWILWELVGTVGLRSWLERSIVGVYKYTLCYIESSSLRLIECKKS